jgi:hypothetical protein
MDSGDNKADMRVEMVTSELSVITRHSLHLRMFGSHNGPSTMGVSRLPLCRGSATRENKAARPRPSLVIEYRYGISIMSSEMLEGKMKTCTKAKAKARAAGYTMQRPFMTIVIVSP